MTPHIAVAVLGFLVAAVPVAAQSLAPGDSLLAAGDSLGAIRAYRTVYEHDPANAEAYYREGLVRFAWARRLPTETVSQRRLVAGERDTAEKLFRTATDLAPDTVRYWLALSDLLRTKGGVFARVQSKAFVDSALNAAGRAGGGPVLADAYYRAGRIAFHQYEQLSRRYLWVGEALTVDQPVLMETWDHVERFLRNQLKPDSGDPGYLEGHAAEMHLRAALSARPDHVESAGLLAVLLGDQERWEEAYALARTLTRAAPDSGRAWAVLGMTLTRLGRWREAERSFDRGLARMAAADRAPYANLGLLLRKGDEFTFGRLPAAQRDTFQSVFWTVNQPLFLANRNEPKAEFFTRLTSVIHRWSDPWRGRHGYETHRGLVFVRYGPPDVWANLGRGRASTLEATPGGLLYDPVGTIDAEGIMTLWAYRPSQLRFLFTIRPGFERARFSGEMEAFYEEARGIFPARFDNVPVVATLDTIAVQVAQFRGARPESTDVAVFSFIPVQRMRGDSDLEVLPFETAAIVKDPRMTDVVRERRLEELRHATSPIEHRSWRLRLAPDEYLMRVEARLPAVDRAARSSAPIDVRMLGRDSIQLSDILLAERAEPRDSGAARWTDFLIEPSPGRFERSAPVTLLWEVYNLLPDSTGTARYTVGLAITVQDIERPTEAARVIGGVLDAIGLTARGDDQVVLEYDRDVSVAPAGAVVEHLVIDLESDRAATYEVTLTVRDRIASREATVHRTFVVTGRELAR